MITASSPKAGRSPSYPSIDVHQAINALNTLYAKDKFAPVPLDHAARTLGFKGLSGGPRAVLATLKQYGFISYTEKGGATLLSLTDAAKDAVAPTAPISNEEIVRKALETPKIYGTLRLRYEGWENLPSAELLVNTLVREFGFGEEAARTLDRVLRKNLEIIRSASKEAEGQEDANHTSASPADGANFGAKPADQEAKTGISPAKTAPGLQDLIMPGSDVFIAVPRQLSRAEGQRVLKWLDRVVKPTIEFAIDESEESAVPGASE